MIYFLLFWEFFQIGLLAVGGGLMTIPFLFALIEKRGWFNAETLSRMIIVSESTPGPVGVNMATYTGWTTAGFWGSLVATSALVLPAFIVILLFIFCPPRLKKTNCRPRGRKLNCLHVDC